jgi:AraC-like DNA-binding protein/mannose-6-phosphate isomerase-like protein (cupin superfamily)
MTAARDYIPARATYERQRTAGELTVYHGRFSGFSAEVHEHPYPQWLFPIAGRMHLMAGDEDHLLGPEWGVVLPPGVPHGFTRLDGELNFLAVYPGATMLADLARQLGEPLEETGALVLREPQVALLVQQLAQELATPQVATDRLVSIGVEALGCYIVRAIAREPRLQTASEPRVLRAVELILRDPGADLSVADLADELAMSPRHFERCFKEALGVTPKQYQIDARVGVAREWLATTDQPVADIALQLGFKNPSHFAETFRKLVGQTPTAFRQSSALASRYQGKTSR